MMTNWAWLAGLVDSEGSIILRYSRAKRGHKIYMIRRHLLKIKTTDPILVPAAAEQLGCSFQRTKSCATIVLSGPRLKHTLIKMHNYLYVKRRQADLCLEAISIKNGSNIPYTDEENSLWNNLYIKVKQLNRRGVTADCGSSVLDHVFDWSWLAGLIDGDGSICCSKFNSNNRKPYIKISLSNHYAIQYLCEKFESNVHKYQQTGNRRPSHTIRLMSTAILRYGQNIIPHLKLKRRQLELAYNIARIRQQSSNKMNPEVKAQLEEIARLNMQYKSKSIITDD